MMPAGKSNRISAPLLGLDRCRQTAPGHHGHSESGFTLMEVMVALAVVAVALAAIYRMHSQTLFMDSRGRFDTMATLLAQQKLADLATGDLADLIDDSGDFGDLHPGYTWRIQAESVTADLLKEDGPALKRINLTVAMGDQTFTLTTYRYLYE
jgi:general secretion pathway protein I